MHIKSGKERENKSNTTLNWIFTLNLQIFFVTAINRRESSGFLWEVFFIYTHELFQFMTHSSHFPECCSCCCLASTKTRNLIYSEWKEYVSLGLYNLIERGSVIRDSKNKTKQKDIKQKTTQTQTKEHKDHFTNWVRFIVIWIIQLLE